MPNVGILKNRILPTVMTGVPAFALLYLVLVRTDVSAGLGRVALALAGAVLFAAAITRASGSSRAAFGSGCLANGLLSVGVAIGLRVQDDLWSGRSTYTDDIDRALGPLTHFVWALAARLGFLALLLAIVLFALSYWFLGPPHRKA